MSKTLMPISTRMEVRIKQFYFEYIYLSDRKIIANYLIVISIVYLNKI